MNRITLGCATGQNWVTSECDVSHASLWLLNAECPAPPASSEPGLPDETARSLGRWRLMAGIIPVSLDCAPDFPSISVTPGLA